MKIIRYQDDSGDIKFAAYLDDNIARRVEGDIFGDLHVTSDVVSPKKLLAPVVPTAVLGIGLNYRRHAEESGVSTPRRPILFMKSPAAVQNPEDPIVLPRHLKSDEVDYVLGYTCANDVSARDWQMRLGGGQWCRGKTFDTFAPLGPSLVLKDEIPDPNRLRIRTILNGKTVQDSNTSDMIFDVPAIIEFLSGSTTLQPGYVILTGTPEGVGGARHPPVFLASGDTVSVEIEKIGTLTNPVLAED
jgi:2-keto-4-pentenoate hydratase/2-oxohepta-3-ene-1,7-dioic acid hydratase in catechol pathway